MRSSQSFHRARLWGKTSAVNTIYLLPMEVLMSPSSNIPYVELHVPSAESEQEFLLLAVQAALIKYRASHHKDTSPPQTTCNDAIALQRSVG